MPCGQWEITSASFSGWLTLKESEPFPKKKVKQLAESTGQLRGTTYYLGPPVERIE